MKEKVLFPIDEIIGMDKAWPLVDVLYKLVEASEILLHKKNYDGHGWEEIEHCIKRGKEIIQIFDNLKNKSHDL
jgi:hypothetical protein